jgi:hypothetical protein
MGIIGCSIYKDWKTIEYLKRFGNTVHKEMEVLEDQWKDDQARFGSWKGSPRSKLCT